ncbi:hypothetical protein [Rhizobium leguminosarum]|uniref:hypothetical protein n=1 Tax=Rhizobium leguminosarum TaxID=384 RepID=UPI001AE3D7EE|nr:hypothetical protein [Rhizobium leguminosarum]MBP2449689.1 hypothetical protein [Rhizobium leguminosarum]
MFNEIIEFDRIDFDFLANTVQYQFSDELHDVDKSMRFIPSAVILALYNFGFAVCLMGVLSAATIGYAMVVIWCYRVSTCVAILMYILIASLAVGLGVIYWQLVRLPASIAAELIRHTIYFLPTCRPTLLDDCQSSIGNTGTSLLRVVGLVMGIIFGAGLAYWMAVITVVASNKLPGRRRRALQNSTILAAAAFLLTIVATHLLFQPGADMITAAYAPDQLENVRSNRGASALANYNNLRNAMTLYWGTVFSLAICTAYFPASISVSRAAGETTDAMNIWTLTHKVITVLSPLIASGLLQLAQAFMEALQSGRAN